MEEDEDKNQYVHFDLEYYKKLRKQKKRINVEKISPEKSKLGKYISR